MRSYFVWIADGPGLTTDDTTLTRVLIADETAKPFGKVSFYVIAAMPLRLLAVRRLPH